MTMFKFFSIIIFCSITANIYYFFTIYVLNFIEGYRAISLATRKQLRTSRWSPVVGDK